MPEWVKFASIGFAAFLVGLVIGAALGEREARAKAKLEWEGRYLRLRAEAQRLARQNTMLHALLGKVTSRPDIADADTWTDPEARGG